MGNGASTLQLAYEVWTGGKFVSRHNTAEVAIEAAVFGSGYPSWSRPKFTVRTVRGWMDMTTGEFNVVAVVSEMEV